MVLLTEFRENSNAEKFKTRLFDLGYKWQASSSRDPVKNSVFLAAKIPFIANSKKPGLGEHAHRLIVAAFRDVNIVGVYFPQKEEKRVVFDHLATKLLPQLGDCTLLLGDFNTGRHFIDEVGNTFHCADCFDQLEKAGVVDSWRSRNPQAKEFSWESSAKNGFRIDHIFCTAKLDQKVTKIGYLHDIRKQKATDHSAMFVEIDLSTHK